MIEKLRQQCFSAPQRTILPARQLRWKLSGTWSLVIIFILAAGCSESVVPGGNGELPDFKMETVADSRQLVSAASLVERPALINVWASWCLACREEHRLLMQLAKSGQFGLYGVNYLDTREDAIRWLDYYGNPFSWSVYDVEGSLGKRIGVNAVPQTFLLGADGRLVYRHVGPLNSQVLQQDFLPRIKATEATTQ